MGIIMLSLTTPLTSHHHHHHHGHHHVVLAIILVSHHHHHHHHGHHILTTSLPSHHHHHGHHHGVHLRLGWLLGERSIGHWSPIHSRIWSTTKASKIWSPIIWTSTRVIGIISPIVVGSATSVTTRIRSRSTCTSTRGRPSASIRTTLRAYWDCCCR